MLFLMSPHIHTYMEHFRELQWSIYLYSTNETYMEHAWHMGHAWLRFPRRCYEHVIISRVIYGPILPLLYQRNIPYMCGPYVCAICEKKSPLPPFRPNGEKRGSGLFRSMWIYEVSVCTAWSTKTTLACSVVEQAS